MAYSIVPVQSAMHGYQNIFDTIVASFSTPERTYAAMALVNDLLNAMISLLITLGVVAFFVYLMCWIFAKEGTELRRSSARNATRTLIALFLMVNIWSIFRTFDVLLSLSDTTAYVVFFCSFFLLGFWMLFSAGDGLLRLLSLAFESVFGHLERWVRLLARRSDRMRPYIDRVSVPALRLIIILAVFAVLTLAGNGYVHSPAHSADTQSSVSSSPLWMVSDPSADGTRITGTKLENPTEHFSIEYPSDWTVVVSTTTSMHQIDITRGPIESVVDIAHYTGTLPSATDGPDFNIVKSILDAEMNSVERSGWQVDSINITPVTLQTAAGSTSASVLMLGLYGQYGTSTTQYWVGRDIIFSRGDTYFNLSMMYPDDEATLTYLSKNVDTITRSIRF